MRLDFRLKWDSGRRRASVDIGGSPGNDKRRAYNPGFSGTIVIGRLEHSLEELGTSRVVLRRILLEAVRVLVRIPLSAGLENPVSKSSTEYTHEFELGLVPGLMTPLSWDRGTSWSTLPDGPRSKLPGSSPFA